MLAVPFSSIGAIALMALLHQNVSVASWVGLIALAGLDAETGTAMLLYLKLALARRREEGVALGAGELDSAIVEGSARRLRPKLMTVCCILFGLVPVLFSHGTGADVLKRIAAPMAGGVVSSFALELLVYPVAFGVLARGRGEGAGTAT